MRALIGSAKAGLGHAVFDVGEVIALRLQMRELRSLHEKDIRRSVARALFPRGDGLPLFTSSTVPRC